METHALFNLIWDTGSTDSIASMHDKARSIVMTVLLGDDQLEPQYNYIDTRQAKSLLPTITRAAIHHFLQTKTNYAVDVRPRQRISYNTTPVVSRHIKWQADLIDLRNMHVGYPYALTIVDTFSKYAWAFPMINKTGELTARLFDALFARQPLFNSDTSQFKPALLLTDQGSEFRSTPTLTVCRHHRVFQIFTLPYTPLGIIERFNQTLKRKLRRAIAKQRLPDGVDLATLFHQLLREYNDTIHTTTQQRPIVTHFIHGQPHTQRVLTSAMHSTQQMRLRGQRRVRNNLVPLAIGAHVRVVSMKDPRRDTKQRQQLHRQMEYKRFGHSYWTRDHYTIQSVDARDNYMLEGHPVEMYRREELQPVVYERRAPEYNY
jgi:transposase InsO family protein